MPSQSGFLNLLRELRDTIYHHYVFEADGYHFDYESGKLRAPANRPIDLALTYTCTFIAAEMHHLALRTNVLNFSTVYSETERIKAARFDMFFDQFQSYKSATLRTLSEPTFHPYKTRDVDAKVALRYPQFESLLHLLHDPGEWLFMIDTDCRCCSWGEAHSAFRGFQDYMIELLSKDTDFPEALANFYYGLSRGTDIPRALGHSHDDRWRERASFVRSALFLSSPEPWTIPSEEDLAQMDATLSPSPRRDNFWERVKWRFSAAAAAIHFFKSVS